MKKNRNIIALLLVVAVIFSAASKSFLLLDFLVNRDYISKNLCEKKELKDNCCRGKCQLKKQLHEEDKREDANGKIELKIETASFFNHVSSINFYLFFIRKVKVKLVCITLQGHYQKIFQPPPQL